MGEDKPRRKSKDRRILSPDELENSSGVQMPVAHAAEHLGVKEDTIRKRIQRGTLQSVKIGPRVHVFVPRDEYLKAAERFRDASGDKSRDESQDRQDTSRDELADELRDRIRYLERQVEEEREARRRADTLLAQLMQRIPELEAPRDEREPPVPSSEASEGTRSPDAGDEAQEATQRPQEHDPTLRAGEEQPRQRRSLWRWILGGGS